MQESDKILLLKVLKIFTMICISVCVSVTIISCMALCMMHKQSIELASHDTEKWRIYFETDYDYMEYPNIDMSQRIGDDN